MFQHLSERLQKTVKALRGQTRITEDNIKTTLREIRLSLLEADVALPVVKQFIDTVKEKAIGQNVATHLHPGQAFIKIVRETLQDSLGADHAQLSLKTQPPAVILMAGLQGSGKTTTAAKLAKWLMERQKKSVLLVSCDVYRPAAIEQLQTLAAQISAHYFPSTANEKPAAIARAALTQAKNQHIDVLIVDTAGRLAIDEKMMNEIKDLHGILTPIETLFVVDSMTGQDAANTAKAFNEALPLTGVVLSKADGDARGGAALSLKMITGKPIKFLGIGEKLDALETFHPDRLAARILGMGDMLSLIEEVEQKVDRTNANQLVKKIKQGQRFNLEDFSAQLQQMNKLGSLGGLIPKLPGLGNTAPNTAQISAADKMTKKMQVIIQSMTLKERRYPDLIKASRKIRIAKGSGTQVQEVNQLLKQFDQMEKIMRKMGSKGGLKKIMRGMPAQFR